MESDAVEAALSQLHSDWSLVSGKLRREIVFANFVEAFSFMTDIAIVAEKRDHHPEWHNVYNRVSVDLITHDADGITELDIQLATHIDAASARFTSK